MDQACCWWHSLPGRWGIATFRQEPKSASVHWRFSWDCVRECNVIGKVCYSVNRYNSGMLSLFPH